jgi:hypothetical protein
MSNENGYTITELITALFGLILLIASLVAVFGGIYVACHFVIKYW